MGNGIVYLTSDVHGVTALDASNGDFVWHNPVEGFISASPILANGLFYVITRQGPDRRLFVLDAADGRTLLRRHVYAFDSSSGEFSSPALSDSRLVINTGQELKVFGLGEAGPDVDYIHINAAPATNSIGSYGAAIAVLQQSLADQIPQVAIVDLDSGSPAAVVPFPRSDKQAVDLAELADLNGNGYTEVAVLFTKEDGRGRIHIRDTGSGGSLGQQNAFGSDWRAVSLASADVDADGVSEIMVLGVSDSDNRVAIQVINFATAGKRWVPVEVGRSEAVLDLAQVPDVNGNGAPDLAVLTVRRGGAPLVRLIDSRSEELIATIKYPDAPKRPLSVTAVADIDGNGVAEIGVLSRGPEGQAKVHLRDAATGRLVATLGLLNDDFATQSVATQDLDGDGVPEVSVLGTKDATGDAVIHVKDVSSNSGVRWIPLSE